MSRVEKRRERNGTEWNGMEWKGTEERGGIKRKDTGDERIRLTCLLCGCHPNPVMIVLGRYSCSVCT